jgi:hypothetical protein
MFYSLTLFASPWVRVWPPNVEERVRKSLGIGDQEQWGNPRVALTRVMDAMPVPTKMLVLEGDAGRGL